MCPARQPQSGCSRATRMLILARSLRACQQISVVWGPLVRILEEMARPYQRTAPTPPPARPQATALTASLPFARPERRGAHGAACSETCIDAHSPGCCQPCRPHQLLLPRMMNSVLYPSALVRHLNHAFSHAPFGASFLAPLICTSSAESACCAVRLAALSLGRALALLRLDGCGPLVRLACPLTLVPHMLAAHLQHGDLLHPRVRGSGSRIDLAQPDVPDQRSNSNRLPREPCCISRVADHASSSALLLRLSCALAPSVRTNTCTDPHFAWGRCDRKSPHLSAFVHARTCILAHVRATTTEAPWST